MARVRFNRRQILSSVSASGATLTLSRLLPAAIGLKSLSFVVVSDTHLGRNDNKAAERNWLKAIDEINELRAEFVIHLGDIVDRGRESQYAIYAKSRELINKPIHEIPGNHDPTELFAKYVAKQVDRCVDVGGVRFVLFNNSRNDSHDGFIKPQQLKWLENQFDDAARNDLRIVVCCHVPVHENRHPDRGWYVKPDNGQQKFYEVMQRHSERILACFHGHFHNGIRGWRDHGKTVETLFPSVCYNQNRGLRQHIAEGKATGFFVEELRPGFVVVEVGEGRLTLRYKPLGEPMSGQYSAAWS